MTAIGDYARAEAEKRWPNPPGPYYATRAEQEDHIEKLLRREGAEWGIEHLAERLQSKEVVGAVAVAIRQAYADDTADGDAELCGHPADWCGEAQAALTAALDAITKPPTPAPPGLTSDERYAKQAEEKKP